MKKIHGLLQGRKIQVVPANCYKPKKEYLQDYDCKPWHHIAVVADVFGIVYVWDTREVVGTLYLSPMDMHCMVHVLDNGKDLILPPTLSDSDVETIREMQQRIDDEPVDCF